MEEDGRRRPIKKHAVRCLTSAMGEHTTFVEEEVGLLVVSVEEEVGILVDFVEE